MKTKYRTLSNTERMPVTSCSLKTKDQTLRNTECMPAFLWYVCVNEDQVLNPVEHWAYACYFIRCEDKRLNPAEHRVHACYFMFFEGQRPNPAEHWVHACFLWSVCVNEDQVLNPAEQWAYASLTQSSSNIIEDASLTWNMNLDCFLLYTNKTLSPISRKWASTTNIKRHNTVVVREGNGKHPQYAYNNTKKVLQQHYSVEITVNPQPLIAVNKLTKQNNPNGRLHPR